eukprot:4722155-Amphidinium_carterae.1
METFLLGPPGNASGAPSNRDRQTRPVNRKRGGSLGCGFDLFFRTEKGAKSKEGNFPQNRQSQR